MLQLQLTAVGVCLYTAADQCTRTQQLLTPYFAALCSAPAVWLVRLLFRCAMLRGAYGRVYHAHDRERRGLSPVTWHDLVTVTQSVVRMRAQTKAAAPAACTPTVPPRDFEAPSPVPSPPPSDECGGDKCKDDALALLVKQDGSSSSEPVSGLARIWLPHNALVVEGVRLGFRVQSAAGSGSGFVAIAHAGERLLGWRTMAELDVAALGRGQRVIRGPICVSFEMKQWPPNVSATAFTVIEVAAAGKAPEEAGGYWVAVRRAQQARLGAWQERSSSDRDRRWSLLSRRCDTPLALAWATAVLLSAAAWSVHDAQSGDQMHRLKSDQCCRPPVTVPVHQVCVVHICDHRGGDRARAAGA